VNCHDVLELELELELVLVLVLVLVLGCNRWYGALSKRSGVLGILRVDILFDLNSVLPAAFQTALSSALS
jgi:hypothetical protein